MVQWFEPTIQNTLGVAIRLAAVALSYGKCYDINSPYNEVSCPRDITINPGASFTFGVSSRTTSISGTAGNFDLQFASGDRLADVYWNCPWGGQDTLSADKVADGYTVTFTGFNTQNSNSLEKGTVTVSQK